MDLVLKLVSQVEGNMRQNILNVRSYKILIFNIVNFFCTNLLFDIFILQVSYLIYLYLYYTIIYIFILIVAR